MTSVSNSYFVQSLLLTPEKMEVEMNLVFHDAFQFQSTNTFLRLLLAFGTNQALASEESPYSPQFIESLHPDEPFEPFEEDLYGYFQPQVLARVEPDNASAFWAKRTEPYTTTSKILGELPGPCFTVGHINRIKIYQEGAYISFSNPLTRMVFLPRLNCIAGLCWALLAQRQASLCVLPFGHFLHRIEHERGFPGIFKDISKGGFVESWGKVFEEIHYWPGLNVSLQ